MANWSLNFANYISLDRNGTQEHLNIRVLHFRLYGNMVGYLPVCRKHCGDIVIVRGKERNIDEWTSQSKQIIPRGSAMNIQSVIVPPSLSEGKK